MTIHAIARAQKRRGNWSTRADRLIKREEFGEA